MPQCTLPKDILFEMEMEQVLPFNQSVQTGPLPQKLSNESQTIKCNREMAAWCRLKAKDEGDAEKKRKYLDSAKLIETVLGISN